MSAIGSHFILEMYGCPPSVLDDSQRLRSALRGAAARAQSTLLGELCHRFEPQGVTVLGLLAESHISIHTWPELGYAAADVFTCGEHTDPRDACEHLIRQLGARRHELRILPRGSAPVPRAARTIPTFDA